MNCKREREKERDWDSMYHGCAPEESQKDSKVSFFLKGGVSFRNRINFISVSNNHEMCIFGKEERLR